jgi:hypothetical protein
MRELGLERLWVRETRVVLLLMLLRRSTTGRVEGLLAGAKLMLGILLLKMRRRLREVVGLVRRGAAAVLSLLQPEVELGMRRMGRTDDLLTLRRRTALQYGRWRSHLTYRASLLTSSLHDLSSVSRSLTLLLWLLSRRERERKRSVRSRWRRTLLRVPPVDGLDRRLVCRGSRVVVLRL